MASEAHRMVEALVLAGHAIQGMANVLKENPGHIDPLPDGTAFTLEDESVIVARLSEMASTSLEVAVHLFKEYANTVKEEKTNGLNSPTLDRVFENLEVQ